MGLRRTSATGRRAGWVRLANLKRLAPGERLVQRIASSRTRKHSDDPDCRRTAREASEQRGGAERDDTPRAEERHVSTRSPAHTRRGTTRQAHAGLFLGPGLHRGLAAQKVPPHVSRASPLDERARCAGGGEREARRTRRRVPGCARCLTLSLSLARTVRCWLSGDLKASGRSERRSESATEERREGATRAPTQRGEESRRGETTPRPRRHLDPATPQPTSTGRRSYELAACRWSWRHRANGLAIRPRCRRSHRRRGRPGARVRAH